MTPSSFKLLPFFSIALKVYAFLTVLLMSVGVVGVFMAAEAAGPQKFQVLLNMILGGTLFFLVLYSLGELIRLLLEIEARTRKENP